MSLLLVCHKYLTEHTCMPVGLLQTIMQRHPVQSRVTYLQRDVRHKKKCDGRSGDETIIVHPSTIKGETYNDSVI